IYLHNRSGARKSSGSYYTKSFAVEHLLDRALEPALQDHFKRLEALDDIEAADALFDFRVADIAMGSAHFLVAAIDRIERRFAEYLSRRAEAGRPLAKVLRELENLREAAVKQLGPEASSVEIEDTQLLRRLIARRCIYGVDLNPLAVELARLAVWIHTFVPGLPLAVLDHNLTPGNALIGIGTMEEIKARLDKEKGDLFGADIKKMFAAAEAPLNRLRQIADASIKDVEASRAAMKEARAALGEMQALCDVLTAEPLDPKIEFRPENWTHKATPLEKAMTIDRAREALKGLSALHFPIAFPEVFLRERSGFDVLLGNPPWKEATIEKLAFWARHFPGLRGLNSREQTAELKKLENDRPDLSALFDAEAERAARFRKALVAGDFPGMGTGDPDVYKAFCWRFWRLSHEAGGRFGVVLPRSAFAAKGSTEFRQAVFANAASADLTMLLNKAGWVFDEAEHRYTIGLAGVERTKTGKTKVALRGPYADLDAYQAGVKRPAHQFAGADVLSWNDVAALPLLPTEKSFEIFLKMRAQPRLDFDDGKSWRARPDAELHATNDKPLMDLKSEKPPKGFWPVMKGESFDIWQPEGGELYGWADPKPVMDRLYDKRLRGQKSARDSAHSEFPLAYVKDRKTLPCLGPRLAFRDVSRSTDNRTVRAALLPPKSFLANQAPYFLWPRGDQKDMAFLLGILSSVPLDWYARRFVETHVNFFVINPFPIPRPERTDKHWKRVVALAGRLAAVDDRYRDWADAVGVDCGPVDALTKNAMIAELDAVAAHLYGLSRDQLIHIFETFHEGWDYAARLAAVLAHFDAWDKKAS
ncbi:MAG: hypothetical protein HXY21_08105, partial [Parvularculaceae bacterium]|nr:hypothetical protein [Parvularculaceae bacterium]